MQFSSWALISGLLKPHHLVCLERAREPPLSSQPSREGGEPSRAALEVQAEGSLPRASGPQEHQVLLQVPGPWYTAPCTVTAKIPNISANSLQLSPGKPD